MNKRFYELYIYNNGDCKNYIGRFSTVKEVDEYIKKHSEHRYLMLNKPYTGKIRLNFLGGKEVY